MANVIAAAKQSLLFSGPGAQQDTASWRIGAVTERLSQFQQGGSPGAVVVRAIPDLTGRFSVVIVMSAYNHDFILQRRILAFNYAKNILSWANLPLDVYSNHGRHA